MNESGEVSVSPLEQLAINVNKLLNTPDYNVNDKYDKYTSIAQKDFTIDLISVKEKIDELSITNHRWCAYVYQERVILRRLEGILEGTRMGAKRAMDQTDDDRYKFMSEATLKRTVSQLEAIKLVEEVIHQQELLVFFVTEHLNTCKWSLREQCQMLIELMKQEDVF